MLKSKTIVMFVLASGLLSCAPGFVLTPTRVNSQFVAMRPYGKIVKNGEPSTVAGSAELLPYNDGKLRITVKLGNLPPDSIRAGRIVFGDCVVPTNRVLIQLDSLKSDKEGYGTVITTLATDRLATTASAKSSLAILYYQRSETDPSGIIGDPITCGDFIYRTD
jgi:hypothetical protein